MRKLTRAMFDAREIKQERRYAGVVSSKSEKQTLGYCAAIPMDESVRCQASAMPCTTDANIRPTANHREDNMKRLFIGTVSALALMLLETVMIVLAVALAAAIRRLVEDPELADRLGDAGRKWVERADVRRYAQYLAPYVRPSRTVNSDG